MVKWRAFRYATMSGPAIQYLTALKGRCLHVFYPYFVPDGTASIPYLTAPDGDVNIFSTHKWCPMAPV
jgi:hypothetical protein